MADDTRPNFLVIMTEQHRGDCLGLEGHPVLLTPSMDEIGATGAWFRSAYSTCPICVPARRSFLSGQFPSTHGQRSNTNLEWDGTQTLPGVLSAHGYETRWVGRSMHQTPPRKRYGFDHMVINDHRIPVDDYDEWLARVQPPGSGGYYGTGVMHNDWTACAWHMPDACHHTNWTVNLALEFLEKRDPSCPFLLVVSFIAAHPPLVPPGFYFDRYLRQDLPEPVIGDWAEPPLNDGVGGGPAPERVHLTGEALRSTRAGYYGLINHVDDQIRRLLNNVTGVQRQTGNNTVVVFTSDHGEMLGDHYRWRKNVPYEGSARIPLLLSAPARLGLQRGAVIDKPVGLEDIMPTLLDLAGVPIPDTVDGSSLLPLLRGEQTAWRDCIHIQQCHAAYHCLTDGKSKYIWFTTDGREQFFDLVADPDEIHDLSADPSRAAQIGAWRERLVRQLAGGADGFSDGEKLIPGRPFPAVAPGCA